MTINKNKYKSFYNFRNPSFGGRAMRGSWERLPREEDAWSRHQRLFEENVGKIKMRSTNFKCERFESCIYVQGRY